MNKNELDRIVFFSEHDMANGHQLEKAESILKSEIQDDYKDINDILELYNLKKYIDRDLFLKSWSSEDIDSFKVKAISYGKIIGRFIANIDETNFKKILNEVIYSYMDSFWEKFDSQKVFEKISDELLEEALFDNPNLINVILKYKNTVNRYDEVLREFLLNYSNSAEILLSHYEVKNNFQKDILCIPPSLTLDDKENILLDYLSSNDPNINYIKLILNMRNQKSFKITDKTRLKAKRVLSNETDKLFKISASMKYGVNVTFDSNELLSKNVSIDEDQTMHYVYSASYIKSNSDPYSLFLNFKDLFEYLDIENRISLVSNKRNLGTFERIIGLRSKDEYLKGIAFRIAESSSLAQIMGYSKVVEDLGKPLESLLSIIFMEVFPSKYSLPSNARFLVPTATSYLEKIRFLAPEFESALKQFKLYVEDKEIDFELLQISSAPSSIKDIPSLNRNKYIYLNEDNNISVNCSDLLFSDQTLLAYVEPFKEKKYGTFFNLLINEDVKFSSYESFLLPRLNYLLDNNVIHVDKSDSIIFNNPLRVLVLEDLYDNEVASFHHYPEKYQNEILKMAKEDLIYLENSLFSKPEQSYFNYYLNKSEFTNGLDLRNSYLHGTQASSKDEKEHEIAYFTYLKLVILAFLKIDDDLKIYSSISN